MDLTASKSTIVATMSENRSLYPVEVCEPEYARWTTNPNQTFTPHALSKQILIIMKANWSLQDDIWTFKNASIPDHSKFLDFCYP